VTAINDRHFMLPSMSLHFLLQLYFLFYILWFLVCHFTMV
jgi:hypothetical protein